MIFILPKIIDIRISRKKKEYEQLEIENKAMLNAVKETQNRIEEILNIDRKERVERQTEFNEKFNKLEKSINDTAITAGLGVIYTPDINITDYIHEVLKLWERDVNGNSIDQTIRVLMKDKQNVSIWKSEVNKYIRKNDKGSDHFQKCIEEVTKRAGW